MREVSSLSVDIHVFFCGNSCGDLQHDAGTIARLVVCPFSATMAHVLKHFQCVVYQFVAFVAVNVDHHTNTTGIMFVV